MNSNTGRRETERILVGKAVLVTTQGAPAWARLADISATGARIVWAGSTQLAPRDSVQFDWEPVLGIPLSMKAQVIWQREEVVGLRFRNLSAKTRHYLRALVRFNRR